MNEVISQFTKNAVEEVRVSLTEYRGHKLIDLRVYYEPRDGGERLPSKKGLTISVELFPELKKALGELEATLVEKKLLEKEELVADEEGGEEQGPEEQSPEEQSPGEQGPEEDQ